jgi:hypothetical protein
MNMACPITGVAANGLYHPQEKYRYDYSRKKKQNTDMTLAIK